MKFEQEYIAKHLHENLQRYFTKKSESIQILIEGVGVHWNCKLKSNTRETKIHCFEYRYYKDIKPEYLISFEESGQNKAWGRTYNIEETIHSAGEWINNKGIDYLYGKYEFIDWYKRKIQEIEKLLIESKPQLKETERRTISPWGSGMYQYYINFKNRSCELNGYGKEDPISFKMQWDSCDLFVVEHHNLSLLAEVLKKWLIDEIEPSKLESQYDWIDVGQLAKHYENGEGIKGEFIESWNSIERFYKEINENFTPKVLNLISKLRQKKFDEKLRAGQSLYTFILSRSRRHGLTQEQNFIALTFRIDKDEMIVTDQEENELFVNKVEYSEELEQIFTNFTKDEVN
ncbi:hypothetical protein H2O64_21495 [Kordia sp. YSTF-M3]|uniref:Uncharacterized protein n=1 Tax=Kordia aestuariivivens TaxID=2759037 RepID=A0ABR7QFB2_9FLAO|nr:hypothetical protein [Kordia aestuariivivens]MBC8757259.1 hypothetical protein [Kordia aestuariivivens]